MENENEQDYTEIDLVEVFHVLVDNLRNILVVTVCCVLAAAGYVFSKQGGAPMYTSEACLQVTPVQKVLAGDRPMGGKKGTYEINNITSYDGLNTTERMQTCAEILKSKSVLQPVKETIGESGSVAAEPVKNTRILKVKFTASTPEKAQKGNERLIRSFQAYLSGKEQSETRYVTADGTTGQPRSSASEVEVVVVSHNEAEIVDAPTLPTAPATKNEKRTLAVSALLGVLLGSGYAVMKALMNRRLTTERDVEDYLKLPVLGVVPEEASLLAAMETRGQKSFLGTIGGFLWK